MKLVAETDFFENGLTDPRVANEQFPFDRPLLSTEAAAPVPSLSPFSTILLSSLFGLAGWRRLRA